MTYDVSETATVMVDHQALAGMKNACLRSGARVALIGFNEYSKHLLNIASENIVTVYDESEWTWGIKFRGRTVARPDESFDVNLLVVCAYEQLYGFVGKMRRFYGSDIDLYYPPQLHYKSTEQINVYAQDAIYTGIEPKLYLSPPSMMEIKKLHFLAELMRVGLKRPGQIIEMGVYQAGSVWYLANVLQALGEQREIYMLDVFETHMMHPNATMCNDEIRQRLSFYPHCHLLEGLVDDEALLSQIRGIEMCFAHYDLGFHPKALAFLWDHLVPGAPLVLDNYGHIAIGPWDLDNFFAERNAHILRTPWSEQGVVFKPC